MGKDKKKISAKKVEEKNRKIVEEVFTTYLEEKKHRKTPERYAVLKEVYKQKEHFDIDLLYLKMKEQKFRVSKATIYNTIELLMECNLIRKHQYGENHASYEKSYFNKQHDHIILDTGEIIEFCDPRIINIQKSVEEIFNVKIDSHSLYFHGVKKQ